jgi:hypothetical protein
MTTPILPDSEMARVKNMAKEWNNRDEWSILHTNVSAFIEGAAFEYSASLQREKDKCIAFANYINDNFLYKMDGLWKKSECESYPQLTDEQLYTEFSESLNKQV